MINKLKEINEKLIIINKNNKHELKKQKLIKQLLSDNNCFFKINIETSYSILKDLNFKDEDLKDIYQKLIDSKNLQN